ncbi:MAG: lamin tail domain-containing protein [Microgenomates group bacterium]
MKKLIVFIVFSICLFSFPSIVKAQVVINEFSSNSDPEWIELYNTTSSPIDITGWTLQDEAQAPKSLSGTISANGYFVFENPSGWLNNSGSDSIILKDSAIILIDSIHYGSGGVVAIPDADKSAARVPNGSSNWQNNLSWTKGASNPESTPTPSPTSIPTPTLSPTQTSTPTSMPSALPTKSPTPTPSKIPSPTPTQTPNTTNQPEVLGLNFETDKPDSEDKVIVGGDVKKKFPIIPVVFIGSGLLMVGFAILQLINARKNSQES